MHVFDINTFGMLTSMRMHRFIRLAVHSFLVFFFISIRSEHFGNIWAFGGRRLIIFTVFNDLIIHHFDICL